MSSQVDRYPHRHWAEALRRPVGVVLGLAVSAALFIAAKDRLRSQHSALKTLRAESTREYGSDLNTYSLGYGLAVVLTLIPFGLVYWKALDRTGLYIAIGVCAFVQAIVHFRCFLHIDVSKQKRDDLQLILFSTLILLLMAGGTIWILGNLAFRMH